MKPFDHGKSLAHRGADHRRSVALGIGLSGLVHVALLAWVVFPQAPAQDAADPVPRPTSDAIELISVRVPDVSPESAPDVAETSSSSAAASATGVEVADAPEASSVSTMTEGSVERVERVQVLAMARPALLEGQIGALGEIRAIEPAREPAITGHEGHLHTLAEEGPGFWERLAEGIQVGVSGGGHCPMDGDLIGAARDRGFAIPQARGGGLNLPRAGGFSIPQSRGLGVRLPGGIGR